MFAEGTCIFGEMVLSGVRGTCRSFGSGADIIEVLETSVAREILYDDTLTGEGLQRIEQHNVVAQVGVLCDDRYITGLTVQHEILTDRFRAGIFDRAEVLKVAPLDETLDVLACHIYVCSVVAVIDPACVALHFREDPLGYQDMALGLIESRVIPFD